MGKLVEKLRASQIAIDSPLGQWALALSLDLDAFDQTTMTRKNLERERFVHGERASSSAFANWRQRISMAVDGLETDRSIIDFVKALRGEIGAGPLLDWISDASVATAAFVRHDFNDFPSLRIDLDPDYLTPGLVATWPNRGPAGGTFTASGTARGTCIANAQNGHNVMDFNGLPPPDGTLYDSTLSGSSVVSATQYTAFGVWIVDACETDTLQPADNDAVMSIGNEFWGMHLTNIQFKMYHFDGLQKAAAAAYTLLTWSLFQGRYDGVNIFARVAAAAESAGIAAGSVQNLPGINPRIGRNYTIRFFDGRLARLLTMNTDLSASEQLRARERLGLLYNVPV